MSDKCSTILFRVLKCKNVGSFNGGSMQHFSGLNNFLLPPSEMHENACGLEAANYETRGNAVIPRAPGGSMPLVISREA
jgi:hypothetical protein